MKTYCVFFVLGMAGLMLVLGTHYRYRSEKVYVSGDLRVTVGRVINWPTDRIATFTLSDSAGNTWKRESR